MAYFGNRFDDDAEISTKNNSKIDVTEVSVSTSASTSVYNTRKNSNYSEKSNDNTDDISKKISVETQQTGNKISKNDLGKAINCIECHAPRFSPCTHHDCRKKKVPYENCHPYRLATGDHSLTYRKPLQTMYYRSIIAKLIELYTLSCMDGYEDILNYRKQRFTREGCIIDAHDGEKVSKQYGKMSRNYHKAAKEFIEKNPLDFLEECSLGMTLFYDGVVNFKRKADSMWPLLCSILDCNPSYRSKAGLGIFLTALHNMAMGSNAEKFLMRDCLTKELMALEKGLIFSFFDAKTDKTRFVFLQARCFYAHLDTKALEKFAMVQASGSKHGCPLCNICTGSYRKSLKKTIYCSCREGLVDNHYCRFVGEKIFEDRVEDGEIVETAAERQLNYYTGDATSQLDITELINQSGALNYTAKIIPAKEISDPKTHIPEGISTAWYNKKWPVSMFKKAMRYPHPDTRPFKPYSRVGDPQYFAASDEAVGKRQAYHIWLANRGKSLPKKPKDCSVRGVHDICPLVEELDSFPFTSFGWDLMHCLSNISGYKFKLYKCERFDKEGARKLAVAQGKHPQLRYVSIKLPWETTQHEQDLMDAVAKNIVMSPYYSTDYSIRYPFKQTGFLRSKHHSVFMTVYETYLLSFTNVDVEYKNLAGRFADDICSMLNPCINVVTLLNDIIPSVDETRAIFLGMFPDSEQVFIFHQMVDIVRHMVNFGHVRSLMCYSGERFNSFLSECISKGGVHYLKTMYHRYVLKEFYMTKLFTDIKDVDIDNCGHYSDFVLKLLGAPDKKQYECSQPDCDLLCESIYQMLISQELDNLYLLSPFYRLYKAFLFMKEYMKENATNKYKGGFWSWLNNIDSEFKLPVESRNIAQWTNKFIEDVYDDYFIDYNFTDIASGAVYARDYFGATQCLLPSMKLSVFNGVVIKGIKFKCRGVDYMNDNTLSKSWNNTRHCSSWCLTHKYDVVEEKISQTSLEPTAKKARTTAGGKTKKIYHTVTRVNTTKVFGQLNFCFRLDMAFDGLIDGVAFGHINTRWTSNIIGKRQHSCVLLDPIDVAKGQPNFVCLNYVCSTSIGLSALDSYSLPLQSSSNFASFTRASTDTTHNIYAPTNAVLRTLYFIELHPERIGFEYGNISEDKDKTKIREKNK